MSEPTNSGDPYALPVVRGKPRQLEATLDPESPRGVMRWRTRLEDSKRPICVSLWSGAGGLDLGLTWAGFDVAVAVDSDQWACQTHAHNSDALVFCRDLADPTETRRFLRDLALPSVDLVVGGFPCQPYSRAGRSIIRHLVENERRPPVDERSFAWLTFVAAVDELKPRRALIENVPDLARYNNGQLLRDIITSLEALDYATDVRILSARQHGVPQYRERLFIQAARPGLPIRWPEPCAAEEEPTLRSVIGDLPEVEAGQNEELLAYEPRPDQAAPEWARRGLTGEHAHLVFDHIARDVRADDLEAFQQLRPGGTYLDVPEHLRRYDDENFTDKYKRLAWDAPARTITAHIARDGYWYIHPEQHRTLTIREAARVQTFPDDFVFAGFPSNRFVQIGNAVPPLLGAAVGGAIIDPPAERAEVSWVPAAALRLREEAKSHSVDPWQVLVSEAAFGGRASDRTIQAALATAPTVSAAADLKGRISDPRLREVRTLAKALRSRHDGDVPSDPEALAGLPGLKGARARLVAAMIHGGEPPVSAGTLRVAERVSGVQRAGSLTGVLHAVLLKLANFGEDAAANRVLVDVGRRICLPANPRCGECPLADACAFAHASPDADADASRPRAEAAAV